MTQILQADHFEPYVGQLVRFKGTRHAFLLKEIIRSDAPIAPGMARQPFLLIFSGPKERDYMPAGIYACEFEDGSSRELYVNPIHTPAAGRQEYQAAFN